MTDFAWLGDSSEDDVDYEDAPWVWIYGPDRREYWTIVTENVDGDAWPREATHLLDDDAPSAWSTVAYIMSEHGACVGDTDRMVAAAPANLGWCFDSQVGMYAYDKNEEWDG